MIQLLSNEGEAFQVAVDVAKQSKLVLTMIDSVTKRQINCSGQSHSILRAQFGRPCVGNREGTTE